MGSVTAITFTHSHTHSHTHAPSNDDALPCVDRAEDEERFKACFSPLSCRAVKVIQRVSRRGRAWREQEDTFPMLLVYWVMESRR